MNVYIKYFLIIVSALAFLTGCADTYGAKIIITNKTGHDQLLVNNKYLNNNESMEESVRAHGGLDIRAFKEERDSNGKVIWGYSYFSSTDVMDVEETWPGQKRNIDLTPEKNQYKYPVQ